MVITISVIKIDTRIIKALEAKGYKVNVIIKGV
jgi:hypothetical protein